MIDTFQKITFLMESGTDEYFWCKYNLRIDTIMFLVQLKMSVASRVERIATDVFLKINSRTA